MGLASGVTGLPESPAVSSVSQRTLAEPMGLLALVQRLERMPAESVGALCFEREPGTPEATVLIEHGRVCWAVAVGSQRRLREILVQRPGGPSDARLDAAVRECIASGRPFGETLVREGIVSEAMLRSALLDHTCEALGRIAAERGLRAHWLAHSRARYDAQFTFTPLELLVGATRLGAPRARVELADRAVAALDGIAHSTLVFDPDGRTPGLPLASAGDLPCRTDELGPLSRWANVSLAALSVPGGDVRAVILRADDEGAVIASRRHGLTVVSFLTSRRDVVLALSRAAARQEAR